MNARKVDAATGCRGAERFWRSARACARRLLLAAALICSGTIALGVPMCTVASGATLSFGTIPALASTGAVTTNSGSSFWVNCTSDVTTTPTIYSSTARTLQSGGNSLPFSLSGASPGGTELPTAYPGMPLAITKNGSNQTVTLYGKVYPADFKALPSGYYSGVVSLTVEY
jgi:spore coat protein U-like protein